MMAGSLFYDIMDFMIFLEIQITLTLFFFTLGIWNRKSILQRIFVGKRILNTLNKELYAYLSIGCINYIKLLWCQKIRNKQILIHNFYYQNKSDELIQPKENNSEINRFTDYTSSNKLFSSKLHQFENLPEPRNATEGIVVFF